MTDDFYDDLDIDELIDDLLEESNTKTPATAQPPPLLSPPTSKPTFKLTPLSSSGTLKRRATLFPPPKLSNIQRTPTLPSIPDESTLDHSNYSPLFDEAQLLDPDLFEPEPMISNDNSPQQYPDEQNIFPLEPELPQNHVMSTSSWTPLDSTSSLTHDAVYLSSSNPYCSSLQIKKLCFKSCSSELENKFSLNKKSEIVSWKKRIDEEVSKRSGLKVSKEINQKQKKNTKFRFDLFTDLYRPTNFSKLLSDDVINRSVLSWLKTWNILIKNSAKSGPIKKPEFPFLLLFGNPGVGKTTLASVCARTMNFEPIIINSSLERDEESFYEPIEAAISCKSLLKNDKNPSCLILDEIDGLNVSDLNRVNSPINKLIKLGQKGKLLRPVICICNDLYAPVLKNLRKISKIILVKPPTNHRLFSALQSICNDNKINFDVSALNKIVAKCHGDIRRAVTELQVIIQGNGTVSHGDLFIEYSNHDPKYSLKNLLNFIWPTKNNIFSNNKSDAFSLISQYDDINSVIEASYTTIMTSFSDPLLTKHVNISKLYSTCDLSNELFKVLLLLNIKSKLMLEPTPVFPELTAEFYSRNFEGHKISSLFDSFWSGVPANFRLFFSPRQCRLELLPVIYNLLHPPVRNVSTSIIPHNDRILLKFVAKLMKFFSLSFTKAIGDISETTESKLIFDPNISLLMVNQSLLIELSHEYKLFVNRELEHGKILAEVEENVSESVPVAVPHGASFSQSNLITVEQVFSPEVKRKRTGIASFLSITSPKNQRPKKSKVLIKFKFHEGSTKAVRRNVSIDEFFV
ncbi:hypothetical protein RCL1_001262 [Eukaryota sp. TZLM3-RCL]